MAGTKGKGIRRPASAFVLSKISYELEDIQLFFFESLYLFNFDTSMISNMAFSSSCYVQSGTREPISLMEIMSPSPLLMIFSIPSNPFSIYS